MLMQLLAHLERVVYLIHELFFLRRESVRMLWVDCRERVALQRIFLTIESYGPLFVVDEVEHEAVCHLPLGVAFYDGCLFLELQHGYSLVHEGSKTFRLLVDPRRVGRRNFRDELLARIVAIGVHSERGKRHEVDAVTFFKRCHVGIAQRKTYNIALACAVASHSSHP